MTATDLGQLRVEVLRRLAAGPDVEDAVSDDVAHGILELSAQTLRTLSFLAAERPRRTMLWNAELDVATFMGRTVLLADHVLFPDTVFRALLRGARSAGLRRAAIEQLRHAELVAAGIAVPVPDGVAMATRGQDVLRMTREDLARVELVEWVREQLIIEGPTAREALFFRAKDDLASVGEDFVLHGRIDRKSLNPETGEFRVQMLHPYEPDFDYRPWVAQETDKQISKLVQRTNERVVTADTFGCEYVSASAFEAKLLRRRRSSHQQQPPQAAMWADVPQLSSLSSPDLARILHHEEAVEDLRRRVRASLVVARTEAQSVDAITELTHELEAASRALAVTANRDRVWQLAAPAGLGVASLVLGALTGGLVGAAGGTLGLLASVAPFLGTRLSVKRDAAYLFVAARRGQT